METALKYHDKEQEAASTLRFNYGDVDAAIDSLQRRADKWRNVEGITPQGREKIAERVALYDDIRTDFELAQLL